MFNRCNLVLKKYLALIGMVLLVSCGGNPVVRPVTEVQPPVFVPAPASPPITAKKVPVGNGAGGYYLDDGPGDNAPENIDSIPDAQIKKEVPLNRANKTYIALGQQYQPMTEYAHYKKQGVASWYGKRFHGKKTSTGEIYDMYAMSGAHTILPIPSYAKVTNVANGRSVVVRINDRGPFKHERLIDLSYAAAYKLRLIGAGSGLVEVESIDTSASVNALNEAPASTIIKTINNPLNSDNIQFFIQAGAFRNEENSNQLLKKIQGLQLTENVIVSSVYNNSLYRIRLGPFFSKKEAEDSANYIRKQLNIAVIVQNQ